MKIRVRSQKCIRHISFQNMKADKTRNIIAIFAISLTAVLFTTIFTIAMSIVYGYEQSNFRQTGSCAHGAFKYLTAEQMQELREDPLIREWGSRRFLGIPYDAPFHKSHVEISWADETYAEWSFLQPVEGRLPEEGTNEAATDTTVLALLGVEPEIGAEFTITFDVDGTETTETFTLCGFWDYDQLSPANHVLLPDSRVQEILSKTNCQGNDGMTGFYSLEVMFRNSAHIEENFLDILARHGYQTEDRTNPDTYIPIGINWGYINVQSGSVDLMTVFSVSVIILLIMLTGYLIIYNIFQISVANDIRFYGLLKTIGTTGKQLRHMILLQAVILSAAGIPIGLFIGYGIGALLTPVVLHTLSVYQDALSVSPWIFIGSALFSLLTVVISCRKPGRTAARISPIEAVRYTEGTPPKKTGRRTARRTDKGASIFRMAWANLGRNRKKTAVTVISLSLSVVLLNLTVTLTNGFDMDKYLSNITADFILANAGYFQTGAEHLFTKEMGVAPEDIAAVNAQGEIAGSGRTYGRCGTVWEFITEDYFRQFYGKYYPEAQIEERLAGVEKENGLIPETVQLYGMEPFCLDKLTVLEGDLSKLYEKQSGSPSDNVHYIAAVYSQDDSGRARENSHWARVGDRLTLRYIDEIEIYNTITGEIYPDENSIPDMELSNVDVRIIKQHEVLYEVAALVDIPNAITYRYYSDDEFVLGADTFRQDTGTNSVLYYIFDMEENASEKMERYLSDFTNHGMTQYAYESKQTYIEGFESEKRMYLFCGSVLSFIIGLIGILNFLNVILTNIIARSREFAVLQSVGMTGRQLKKMLITEGVLLMLGSVCFALLLTVATAPLAKRGLGGLLWFFTYRFTAAPLIIIMPFFALIGVFVPLLSYRQAAGKSIVERLREDE